MQFKETMHATRIQNMTNISTKYLNSRFTDTKGGTYFVGENNTNQRSVKQRKFTYERFGRFGRKLKGKM